MDVERLVACCRERLPATLALLREMVAVNSFTQNAAGVNLLSRLTAERFAPLGLEASFPPSTHPDYGDHLVLRTPRREGAPTIALVSHLDTVFPAEEEQRNNFQWRDEGARIYGPGTNDIKGGTALIHLMLSVLAAELPSVFSSVNWVVLLNACEEVISADFREVCVQHLPADTLACLVFEADGGEGDIFSMVRARKGRTTFVIEVEGRGAHAGSSHQRGANAIVELAGIVQRLSALTNYAEQLTVNFGSISGGTVANRVPHHARAELEMRAFDPDVFARAKATIQGCAGPGTVQSEDGSRHRCQVTVTGGDQTPPWPRNRATDDLLQIWLDAGKELGLRCRSEERGGLSDGNVLCDLFPTLDGLGPRGDNSHCSERSADGSKEQEWVDVTSFAPKAALNVRAIVSLLQRAASD